MVGRSGLVRRGEVKRMEAVSRYVLALQMALIWGAAVRMSLHGSSVGVVSVEVGSHWLEVGYIPAASPEEQFVAMPLSTPFTVAFDDYPQELVEMGWQR